MRVGKRPAIPTNLNTTDSGSSIDGSSITRRQSIAGAVSAFAAELRARPKKSSLHLPRFTSTAAKSSDDLSSLQSPTRSKSCSYLPSTAGPSTTSEEPLLTLVLASTSFLDTTISESEERLYVIDTKGARTNISREDPIQGIVHVCAINWADEHLEDRPLLSTRRSVTIQMELGRLYHVEDFLRRTKLTSSRLFNVPHYPHPLKWKRSGSSYKLTVSKAKLTVAVLEPASHSVPARIKVFDRLYKEEATNPLRQHRGVPVILLDYLIVTALLISVEKEEWLAAASGAAPSSGSAYSAPHGPGLHGSVHRWRMEVPLERERRPEPDVEEEEEYEGSRPSTPEAAASSVITSSNSNSNSNSNDSTIEVNSDPGATSIRLGRRPSSPLSQSHSHSHSHSHSVGLSVGLSRTPTSPIATTAWAHEGSAPRSPGSLIHPPMAPQHPFASEESNHEDSDDDAASLYSSPLMRVLPPTLNVSQSLGGGGDTTPTSPSWSSKPNSPDSTETRYEASFSGAPLASMESSTRRSRGSSGVETTRPEMERLELELAQDLQDQQNNQTPRLANASLPGSPLSTAATDVDVSGSESAGWSGAVPDLDSGAMRSHRQITAAVPTTLTLASPSGSVGASGGNSRSSGIGRRPFRPLPKPPVAVPGEAAPAPHAGSMPSATDGSIDGSGTAESANAVRPSGSRVMSLSSVPRAGASAQEARYSGTPAPYLGNLDSLDSRVGTLPSSNTSSDSNSTSNSNSSSDGPRTIRRTASETTLSAKIDPSKSVIADELEQAGEGRAHEAPEFGRDLRRDSLILKTLYRNSIYKAPLNLSPRSSSPPLRSSSPNNPGALFTSNRTLSESNIHAQRASSIIPPTAPLRIRQPRPLPASSRSTSTSMYDSLSRPSTSSSSSYSHTTPASSSSTDPLPSRPRRMLPDEEDLEENGSVCGVPPPAYDTIDFSHPPLKTTGSVFRGVE